MSTVYWLIPHSHLVVVPLQVALRHSLLPYEIRPGPSLPAMSARVSIDMCAWSISAILRPRMASTRRPDFPRRRGRPSRRQARLCWKIGSASPTHVPATIACFQDILQQIVLRTMGQAATLRVILEWLASTHEAVVPKYEARSAVRAWYRTNGVNFGRHDTNFLSLMTAAVNKAGLAVPKAGRPTLKRAVGRKTNPVNGVPLNDDSTSESSSSFFLLLYRFLFHESSRKGDHRVCRLAIAGCRQIAKFASSQFALKSSICLVVFRFLCYY
jgi:hypothetical protein